MLCREKVEIQKHDFINFGLSLTSCRLHDKHYLVAVS